MTDCPDNNDNTVVIAVVVPLGVNIFDSYCSDSRYVCDLFMFPVSHVVDG